MLTGSARAAPASVTLSSVLTVTFAGSSLMVAQTVSPGPHRADSHSPSPDVNRPHPSVIGREFATSFSIRHQLQNPAAARSVLKPYSFVPPDVNSSAGDCHRPARLSGVRDVRPGTPGASSHSSHLVPLAPYKHPPSEYRHRLRRRCGSRPIRRHRLSARSDSLPRIVHGRGHRTVFVRIRLTRKLRERRARR